LGNNLPNKVLIIDSDHSIAAPIASRLKQTGVEVIVATDLNSAQYRFNNEFFRVVLITLTFPEIDGLSLIQKWRDHEIKEKTLSSFVLLTASSLRPEQQSLLNELGGIFIHSKPLEFGSTIKVLQLAYGAFMKATNNNKIKEVIEDTLSKGFISPEQALTKIKSEQERLGDAYYELAFNVYTQLDHWEEALDFLSTIPQDKIDPLKKLNLMSKCFMKLGRWEEAKLALRSAEQQAPNHIERLQSLVDIYLNLKDPYNAIQRQKKVLDLTPDDEKDVKFDMFQKLEEHGFDEHAQKFCQETTEPGEVVKHFNNKGVMYAKDQDLDSAITDYKRAISYFPESRDNYLIYYNLALAFVKKKDPELMEKAKMHLETCLTLNPDYPKGEALLNKVNSFLSKQKSSA
jgi:tetratricopeptide (TPR) repeat protein